MPRSAILTGRFQQRDRAQLRGRLDRHGAPRSTDVNAALDAWLDANVRLRDEPSAIESLDLTSFLRRTATIDIAPDERLRRLAIHIESDLAVREEQLRAWLTHDRIYRAALDLNPRAVWVQLSRAISAREHSEALPLRRNTEAWKESPLRRRMMRTARDALREALAVEPDSAEALCLMGQHCYFDPDEGLVEAVRWYEGALEREPGMGWALLYRAHCLHDLERWKEAAEAYDAVPPNSLTGPKAWRYEHLLEQRAYCLWRAGEVERATRALKALLTRWERSPQCASEAWGWLLAEAARGSLHDALFARACALYAREENERHVFGLSLSMLEPRPPGGV